MKAELQEIASQFALEGAITAIDSLGEGFINDTFIVRTAGKMLLFLRRITSSSAKTRASFPTFRP